MIALFANHGESPKLLHRSLDLLYNMTRHDKNLAAEFGKKNGLNPLVRLMRTYVEEPDGDIIQLSFHCMVELCKVGTWRNGTAHGRCCAMRCSC